MCEQGNQIKAVVFVRGQHYHITTIVTCITTLTKDGYYFNQVNSVRTIHCDKFLAIKS